MLVEHKTKLLVADDDGRVEARIPSWATNVILHWDETFPDVKPDVAERLEVELRAAIGDLDVNIVSNHAFSLCETAISRTLEKFGLRRRG